MTDIMDSGNLTGAPGANQTPSSAGSDQPGSSVSADKDLQSLYKRIEALERGGQSTKDRAVARLQKQYDELFERLVNGLVPAEAPAPAVAGTQQTPAKPDLQAIVEQLGLDPNSPEITDLLRSESDPTQFAVKAAKVFIERKSVQPNPGAVMQTGGPVAPIGDNIGTLTAELNALNAEPSKNAAKIAAVSAKLEAAIRGT